MKLAVTRTRKHPRSRTRTLRPPSREIPHFCHPALWLQPQSTMLKPPTIMDVELVTQAQDAKQLKHPPPHGSAHGRSVLQA